MPDRGHCVAPKQLSSGAGCVYLPLSMSVFFTLSPLRGLLEFLQRCGLTFHTQVSTFSSAVEHAFRVRFREMRLTYIDDPNSQAFSSPAGKTASSSMSSLTL